MDYNCEHIGQDSPSSAEKGKKGILPRANKLFGDYYLVASFLVFLIKNIFIELKQVIIIIFDTSVLQTLKIFETSFHFI